MKILRKQKAIGRATIQQEELARSIANTIVSAQADLAGYLNVKTNRLSQNERLILFVAFIILYAALNIYILI